MAEYPERINIDVKSSGFVAGLLLGILTGGLGVLAVLWAYRRGALSQAPIGMPVLGPAPVIDTLAIERPAALGDAEDAIVKHAKKVPARSAVINTPPPEYAKPIAESFFLPGPGQPAIRVASTANMPYGVQVRPVDPPGAFAILSFNSTALDIGGASLNIPVGDTIIVPVGQWQQVPMGPHMSLYARGNVPGVTLSVSGAPAKG